MALFHLQHPVADADVGLDVLGIRVLFQLFPQSGHVHPERGHVAFPAAAPDFARQVGVGQNLSCVPGQQAQQLVFRGGQLQLLPVQIGAARAKVDGELSVAEHRLGGRALQGRKTPLR